MRRGLLLATSAICALATVAPAAAQAAGAPASERNDIDEVVVTAERFGSGLSRATFALGVEDIQSRPPGADITQALVKVPGIQVSTGDSRGGSFSFEIYMRGLTDEQIGLTLDGVPTGDSRFNGGSPPARFIETSNIARINVSQSSGDIGAPSRFALGGFIDFITDDPREEFGGTVELSAGSFDFRRIYARLDTGALPGGWAGYATYSDQSNDIWAGRRARDSYRRHYELKLRNAFGSGSSIEARVSYNDQKDNDFNIITRGEFELDPRNDRATDVISGVPARDIDYGGALGGVREDFLAYVNGRFQLTEQVLLSVNPYYQTLEGESFRYQDRSRILTGGNPRAVLGYNASGGAIRPVLTTLRNSNVVGGPADMRVTPRDRERYGVTGELRWENLAPGHTLRIGAWYEGGESTEARQFFPIVSPATSIAHNEAALNFVEYERSASVETVMIYAQDQFRALGDRLKIDLGLVFYDLSYDAKSPLEYAARVEFSQDSGLNPKIGMTYALENGFEVFAGYARNFAGIPEDAFLGSTAVINPGDLDPVETENFDAGLRYVQPNAAFSLQAYRVELKNNVGIVPRDTSAPVDVGEVVRGNVATRAANTAGQTTEGLEVTGFYDFGPVDLYGSYSYQNAKHDDPPAGSAARRDLAAIGVIGGARVRDIPEHAFYGQVGWEPLDALRVEVSARRVGRRVGGHIIRPVTFEEIEVEEIGAYTLVNLSARYQLERAGLPDVTLQFNIDNLFQEEFIGAVSGATATQPEFGLLAGPAVRTLDRYFIGAPRTYTVSVIARF